MNAIRIPPELRDAVDEDDYPERLEWLAALPGVVEEIASAWQLGDPYLPGGQCAWVAPARNRACEELALKVGWRHREAEHEADALRFWNGDGAVRCIDTRSMPWLVIDPKPFVGDPAFDPVQHTLNCDRRLAADPEDLSSRMAELLELDPERVRLWLFARCAQESSNYPNMRAIARRLAP